MRLSRGATNVWRWSMSMEKFDLYVFKLHPGCIASFQWPAGKLTAMTHGLWTAQWKQKTLWLRKWRHFRLKLCYLGYTQINVSCYLQSLSLISVNSMRKTVALCPKTGVLTSFCRIPPIQPIRNSARWVLSSMINHMVKSRKWLEWQFPFSLIIPCNVHSPLYMVHFVEWQ